MFAPNEITVKLDLLRITIIMVRPGRDKLSGIIEVDETYLDGMDEGLRGGRQIERKTIIVVATEINGKAIGRIRMKQISDASSESLHNFINET